MRFSATLEIIGVNPFVFVPPEILAEIFRQAKKERGAIPVRGQVNSVSYRQTLVRYQGHWRLYINTSMLKHSPKRIGERIDVVIEHDPEERTVVFPDAFRFALAQNDAARATFEQLSPSRQREILRYLANLKSPEALERNVRRAIGFLLGNERFGGRSQP